MNVLSASGDPRVKAIREHPLVGSDTMSTLDECYSDKELAAILNESLIATPAAAIKWAVEFEDSQMEKAMNQQGGEDDDPQLKMYTEYHEGKQTLLPCHSEQTVRDYGEPQRSFPVEDY